MKSIPKIVASLVFSAFNAHVNAQQEVVSTFFWNSLIQTNPAMTGATHKHAANVVWKDFLTPKEQSGLPRQTTLWANYAYKMDKINSGVGVSYRYDAISAYKQNKALLSYAYHLPIKSLFLSIGASGGITTMTRDTDGLVFSVPVPTIHYDPAFIADAGIALRHEKWNIGLSVTQLNSPTYRYGTTNFIFQLVPHWWLFADYQIDVNENWNLTPRMQLMTDRNNLFANIQLLATRTKKLWFGVGVKTFPIGNGNFTISGMVGYDIRETFRVGYALNFSRSPYAFTGNQATHEIVLSFLLKK